jgi:DNA-binding protein HU-beta
LNKAQFIEKLSQNAQLTKAQTENILDEALLIIKSAVKSGEDVKFVGFGTFDRSLRKSRKGRNPKTGATITIPESVVPRFRPGKEFKEMLQDSY